MTQAYDNIINNEALSAILDEEQPLSNSNISADNIDTLGRYVLIGDIMRSRKDNSDLLVGISSRIEAKLEPEEVNSNTAQLKSNKSLNVDKAPLKSVQSNDGQSAHVKSNVVAFNWRKPAAQLAIAASVAMFAIVGVNMLPQGENAAGNEIPSLQTIPLTGSASPVSYSSEPALENAEQGLRELQQQRIGALVLEHQRQARIAKSLKTAQTDTKAQQE